MNTIRIGDDWVKVPPQYLMAESEYTRTELRMFSLAEDNTPAKEYARKQVLQKRVEFYELVKDGTILIPPPPEPVEGWFTKLLKRLTS